MARQYTTKLKLPYPQPADPISNGADDIRRLAQSVDAAVQAGTVNVPITTANTVTDAVVTFPTPFAAVPIVTVSAITTGPHQVFASPGTGSITANGFTVKGIRTSGVSAFDAAWVAVGSVSAIALALDSDSDTKPSEPEAPPPEASQQPTEPDPDAQPK